MEALLDRINGQPPVITYIVERLEALGYSWAHRVVNTAGSVTKALQQTKMPCNY